jgi:hypothetical protein
VLIMDSYAKRKISTIKQIAEQFPLPAEILRYSEPTTADDHAERSRELRAFIQNSTIAMENYSVTFTVEERSYGRVRHLIVTHPNGTPERAAVRLLVDEFGIRTPISLCLVTEEKFGKTGTAVHIVEPFERTPEFQKKFDERRPIPA